MKKVKVKDIQAKLRSMGYPLTRSEAKSIRFACTYLDSLNNAVLNAEEYQHAASRAKHFLFKLVALKVNNKLPNIKIIDSRLPSDVGDIPSLVFCFDNGETWAII